MNLLRPYSVSRGYWYCGRPPEDADTVLYVGSSRDELLLSHFDAAEKVGNTYNEVDVNNSLQGGPIFLCEGPHEEWLTLWPELRRMSAT